MAPSDNRPTDPVHVADLMRDFNLRAHGVIDRIMREHGASYARTRLLSYIEREGPIRSIDLAETFQFAPRTVTEAIDSLERDALIRRVPDARDRRAKRIFITEAGLAALAKAEPARRRFLDAVFGVLEPAEEIELARLFGKLNDRLTAFGEAPSSSAPSPSAPPACADGLS